MRDTTRGGGCWIRRCGSWAVDSGLHLDYYFGMDILLTAVQAAKILGVSRQRVQQLVDEGVIKASRFGRALAFRPVDVERAKSRRGPGRPRKTEKKSFSH